ncbi:MULTISPECIES: hypothetical protein [unclassified Aurantimonas]|uniref:hypothetical protein n=1 Tax=unclassified Aurantimonas TaxID=2638230 RepID=UPI002E16BB9B|nr:MULTISPECIES: hypothetical protein [unclassified Aurantimonas]MEC5291568.1 hypothetical protein [Aurantimonas sp. C2-3-R2]MEC5412652.1 hypothetical protein [Aurantimonas sp. C2-4-R8]
MKALEAMIAWNPKDWSRSGGVAGAIEIGPWPDKFGWSDRYALTVGACLLERHNLTPEIIAMLTFVDFHTCVVRDGVDPLQAHLEFIKIDEFRERVSPD